MDISHVRLLSCFTFVYAQLSIQVGPWSLHVPEFRCCGWVSSVVSLVRIISLRFSGLSKQARRTGMAGPLGELFDHGIHLFRRAFP